MFKAKVRLINQQDSNLRGYADVDIDGIVTLRNVRIIEGDNGLFTSLPSIKDRNENYRPVCRISDDYWREFNESVIREYNMEVKLAEIKAEMESNEGQGYNDGQESEQESEEPEPEFDQTGLESNTTIYETQMTM